MEPAYAQIYQDLYERHWWWRAREDFLIATLRAHCPEQGWGRILDVGCGDGLFFEKLMEFGDVEGVEPDASQVGDRHRQRIHVQPFDDAFQPGKCYSLILMLDVLEHLADPAAALLQTHRLLEDDGSILITVPAFNSAWTRHDDVNGHRTRYTRRSMRIVVERAGLVIREQRYFFHWVYFAKLLQRGYEVIVPPQQPLPRVPPPWVNQLLYRMSRLESRLLGRLSVPFGGSLLVILGGKPQI